MSSPVYDDTVVNGCLIGKRFDDIPAKEKMDDVGQPPQVWSRHDKQAATHQEAGEFCDCTSEAHLQVLKDLSADYNVKRRCR